MDQPQRERDAAISQYVIALQERYPEFARQRRRDMRLRGYDAISQAIAETIGFGTRTSYEKILGEMLTDAERDLLRHDPLFSEAWHVFMDIRWIRKQCERVALWTLLIALLLGLAAGLGWAFYQLIVSLLSPGRK